MKLFFYRVPQNLGRVFWGKNLFWHGFAMAVTFICVTSGFDRAYHQSTQIPGLLITLWPGVVIGLLLPVLAPIILLIWGWSKKSGRTLNTAFALGQAAALGWLVAAFYKFFTGRPGPENLNKLDLSRVFRFGLYRGGIFWGWPSSHTTVAFAMGLTLYKLYPDNKSIKYLSVIYALYIGISVSVTIHWFSDFLAGALFGSLVGLTVGKSFLEKHKTD
jgi:membrane-associated phospholipid phosphatase